MSSPVIEDVCMLVLREVWASAMARLCVSRHLPQLFQLEEPMKRKLSQMIMPDDPLMTQAIDAMKAYHQAQAAGLPASEVERLRVEAEHLFQTISEYQLAVLGHQRNPLH